MRKDCFNKLVTLFIFLIFTEQANAFTFLPSTRMMNKNKNSNTLQQKPHTEHHLTSVTSVEPSVHHQDEQQNQQPLITFGVLADIQYAPIPDGVSFGGGPR